MDKIEIPVSNENADRYVVSYKRNIFYNKKAIVFMAGLCTGILFFAYSHFSLTDYEDILGVKQLAGLRGIDSQKSGIVQYILCVRLKQLLLLVLCASSIIAPLLMYIISWYLGFGLGIVLLSVLCQYGIKGIFLGGMMFFPHGIFYLLIFLIIFYKIGKDDAKYNQKDMCEKCILKGNRTIIKQIIFSMGDLLLVVMLLCLGVLSETYLNVWIMRKISLLF